MKYYILCLDRSREWWALWLAPNAQGYTGDLDKAGLYTAEEAELHATPDDVPVPEHMARARTTVHVDLDALLRTMRVAGCGTTPPPADPHKWKRIGHLSDYAESLVWVCSVCGARCLRSGGQENNPGGPGYGPCEPRSAEAASRKGGA